MLQLSPFLFPPFYDLDLHLRQPVELVHQFIDRGIRRLNLLLDEPALLIVIILR
jgi:hypothetical protein